MERETPWMLIDDGRKGKADQAFSLYSWLIEGTIGTFYPFQLYVSVWFWKPYLEYLKRTRIWESLYNRVECLPKNDFRLWASAFFVVVLQRKGVWCIAHSLSHSLTGSLFVPRRASKTDESRNFSSSALASSPIFSRSEDLIGMTYFLPIKRDMKKDHDFVLVHKIHWGK